MLRSTRCFSGQLTSVKISDDSQFALINHAPNVSPEFLTSLWDIIDDIGPIVKEILLWDLTTGTVDRKYTGQQQGRHIIRSCFGGVNNNFIVSGSEG